MKDEVGGDCEMRNGIADNIVFMADVMNELRPTLGDELFHYVSLDKSKYILEAGGDIYCGHSNFMNDKLESWQGCLTFLKYLKRILSEEPYRVLETNLRENSAVAKLTTSGYSYFMPYVMCVMPEKDSVYQWRNYTDREKGGYCFGFNLSTLRAMIKQRNERFNTYSTIYLAPCFYIGEDDTLIDDFMSAFIEVFAKKDLEKIETNLYTDVGEKAVIDIIGAVMTLAPLFKDKKWKREKERRLILKKSPVLVKQTYERSHLSDVCEHPFNLMSSITISPHGNQAELLHNLRSRIAIPENGKVFASTVDRRITDYYITKEDIDDAYEKYVLGEIKNGRGKSIISQEEFRSSHSEEGSNHV